jgi:hypothetical protein
MCLSSAAETEAALTLGFAMIFTSAAWVTEVNTRAAAVISRKDRRFMIVLPFPFS